MTVIIAALATWQIIEIWHHSMLFAPIRAITETWDSKLGELLTCPFCLSPWVAGICIFLLSLASTGLVGLVLSGIVYSFAVARLANLGNDFFRLWSRTPRFRLPTNDDQIRREVE